MELQTQNRTVLGKKTKCLRLEGLIPAELYGNGIENKHLSVKEKEFEKIYKKTGEHTLVYAVTEKDEKIPVFIVNATKNPISNRYLSIDLHQVKMDEEIHTKVPIEFIGEAPATKKGLFIAKILNELEIKALPKNIPHSIQINIDALENEKDSIHIQDISVPKEVKILVPQNTVIAIVTAKTKEEVQAPTATEGASPEASVKEEEKETK